MQHLEHYRGQPFRSYLASLGSIVQQLVQCAEAGEKNFVLEPGQQLRVAARLAEEAAVRITLDSRVLFAHVKREPDQVVAENPRLRVHAEVGGEPVERVDH